MSTVDERPSAAAAAETPATGAAAPAEMPATGAPAAPAGAGAEPADERRFTQADIERIAEQRVAEAARRAEQEREEQRLLEEGKYQELLARERTRVQELERSLAQQKLELVRTRVAQRHVLPELLASRLQGETEEELDADARRLADLMNRPTVAPPAASPANPAREVGPPVGPPSWLGVFRS